jgi:hypothetical protein
MSVKLVTTVIMSAKLVTTVVMSAKLASTRHKRQPPQTYRH